MEEKGRARERNQERRGPRSNGWKKEETSFIESRENEAVEEKRERLRRRNRGSKKKREVIAA